MAPRLSGGCACGAIRYESDAEPTVMLNCHCKDCRKASGSGYAAIVIVLKSSLQLSGEARYHKLRGGSGSIIERGFCSNLRKPPLCAARAVSKRARYSSGQPGRSCSPQTVYGPLHGQRATMGHNGIRDKEVRKGALDLA
jgi:hypothetical protein